MYTYLPSASSTEKCDSSYSSKVKKRKRRNGSCEYDSVLRKRTTCIKKQKTPFAEWLVCVLFSMAKSLLRINAVFVSVARTFYFFALSAAKFPLG